MKADRIMKETGPETLRKDGERIDDLQLSGLKILQDPRRFCFGMDAVLLSGFARCDRGDLLDLGTGTGILPLLLSVKTGAGHLTGLEIQEESADMARRSVRMNGLEERITIVTGDLKEAGEIFSPASFDVVTCNPPYIAQSHGLTNPSDAKAVARHEILCTLSDVVGAAAKCLKVGGKFYMVHLPERLPECMYRLHEAGLEPKRLRIVYPTKDQKPSMVLIASVRGGKGGLTLEPPLIVCDPPGVYSEELRRDFGY